MVVHFQAFPSFLLLRCTNPEESEHFYFHSLKQALFLLHGTTRLFNELSVEQQRSLWRSVQFGDHVQYGDVAGRLRPSSLLSTENDAHCHTEAQAALAQVKIVPVRLLRPGKPALQRPVRLRRSSAADAVATDGSGSEVPEAQLSLLLQQRTLGEVLSEDFAEALDINPVKCIIQGITVPLEAPIYDLWCLMSHCDLFLYIIAPKLGEEEL